jgi:hypothetical protein
VGIDVIVVGIDGIEEYIEFISEDMADGGEVADAEREV